MILESLESAFRYPSLHRAQWKSPAALEEIQWKRFKRILDIAYQQTDFYSRRFREAGIAPEDIRGREDLGKIPLTTRHDLRRPEDLVINRGIKGPVHSSMTTGSTGVKTRMHFDHRAWFLGRILLKVRARLACGARLSDRIAILQLEESFRANTPARQLFLRQRSILVDQPISSVIRQIHDYRPTVLYGSPSFLSRLARETAGLPNIARVFTSGEFLDRASRRLIEETFRAKVFDIYGCTELKEIAWECGRGEGYHINSDWVLVECDTQDGDSDSSAPLIVSSLFNASMPVIRYVVGDSGTLIHRPCSCGRGLPLMAPTRGRLVDFFQMSDGSEVSPYDLIVPLEHVAGLKQFQVVQEALDRVVVNAVVDPGRERPVEVDIRGKLEGILPGIEIQVRWHEEIGPESTGKYRIVKSRVGAA